MLWLNIQKELYMILLKWVSLYNINSQETVKWNKDSRNHSNTTTIITATVRNPWKYWNCLELAHVENGWLYLGAEDPEAAVKWCCRRNFAVFYCLSPCSLEINTAYFPSCIIFSLAIKSGISSRSPMSLYCRMILELKIWTLSTTFLFVQVC